MRNPLTEEQVEHFFFDEGFNCCQAAFLYAAEELGLERETVLNIASGFGGGMEAGEVCGCVTGALMALGQRFGFSAPGDGEGKARMKEKVWEFQRRFREENGSLLCRDLLGYDFSTPEGRQHIMESGVLRQKCPGLVITACDILDELL